jgi:hypothetical protein
MYAYQQTECNLYYKHAFWLVMGGKNEDLMVRAKCRRSIAQ